MRVTQFSKYTTLQSSIEEIQSRKYFTELRLATGKNNVNISEAPNQLVLQKRYENQISMQQQYLSNVDYAINFLQHSSETLQTIANLIQQIRETSIDSAQGGVSHNVSVLGKQVRGLLEDIIRNLNTDFDGQFLFAGSLTTPNSLNVVPGSTNNLPYEIIQNTPTQDNPSGYNIVFKGNIKKITIDTSKVSKEFINTTADELFGDTDLASLNNIVKLYNLLTYNQNGQVRGENDLFSKEDFNKLNEYQKELGKLYDKLNSMNSRIGSLLNRLEAQKEQSKNLITVLNGFKSKVADADFVSSSISFSKEQTALQFALQVGAKLSQYTLFDFLR
ncbi:MAG: flagellin [Ignavibacteria bacterium]|nr:flagellin [Ignavibacteria bacterium]